MSNTLVLTPLMILVSLVLDNLSKNTTKTFIANTNKVNYVFALVTRQLEGIQHVSKMTKLS